MTLCVRGGEVDAQTRDTETEKMPVELGFLVLSCFSFFFFFKHLAYLFTTWNLKIIQKCAAEQKLNESAN